MVYRPPYPWYFDHPTHGILTPYPWYIGPLPMLFRAHYPWYIKPPLPMVF